VSSSGDISSQSAAGLIYSAYGATEVTNAYSTGDIDGELASGLINLSYDGTTVSNSFTTGDITGDTSSGLIFIANDYTEVTNSFTTGDILGTDSSGLINNSYDSTTVSNSFTTGDILGFASGGLIATAREDTEVTNSFTTGDILGLASGGLIHRSTGQTSVADSFTSGAITGANAAGIVRRAEEDTSLSNVFTTGDIAGSSAGGIIGIALDNSYVNHAYATGEVTGTDAEGIIGTIESGTPVVVNVKAADPWSDADATAYLIGSPTGIGEGEVWGQCEVNAPYFLVAFYSLNPCEDSPDRAVTVSNTGDVSPTSISGRSFTLVNEYSSAATPTFISIVNGTGSVSMDGVDCDYLLSCRVTDFVSTVGSAKSNFSISSTGTVIIKRLYSDGTIEDLEVLNVRRSSSSALLTITLDPSGGVCGEHSSPWTVTQRHAVDLPTATDCTRDGYTLLGWTRDPANTAPENLLHNTISRSGTVTAVWGQLPNPPPAVFVLRDFLCNQCGNALVIWQTTDTDTTGFTVTVDDTPATCTPTTLGAWWLCGVSGLTPNQPHTFGVSIQNTNGTSSTTKTTQ
jgi:hypothetical protein